MFRVGDLIAYGSSGACRIEDITSEDVPGAEGGQMYYVIKPLYQSCTIYTPVEAESVSMRPIISKEEAERLINSIPNTKVSVCDDRSAGELGQRYKNSIKQYDCRELLKLTMSIYAKKTSAEHQKRKLGTIDEKYMKLAEDLLFGELAAALCIPKDDVQSYIARKVEQKQGGEDLEY